MVSKTCQICGKSSGMYPLCREHLQLKNEGKVLKCENCGEWHTINTPCQCKNQIEYTELPEEGFDKCIVCSSETDGYAFCLECWKKYSKKDMLNILNNKPLEEKEQQWIDIIDNEALLEEENSVITINSESKSKCITCGKSTDGLLFCPSCFKKYKEKSLLFRITNCSNVELLSESYEGQYYCKDGHIVKSKSERFIDDYLFEHNIPHAYEKKLYYGSGEKDFLKPDFHLPNFLGEGKDVYLEHWGYNENNIKYTETKKFKIPIYQKLNITLICTYKTTDMSDVNTSLERKLNKLFIKENEINFLK